MQTAILIVQLLFLILATLIMVLLFIRTIKQMKLDKEMDKAMNEFCDKIANAIVKCERKDIKTEQPATKPKRKYTKHTATKAETKETIDYNKLPITKLYQIAKDKGLKGYQRLHKKDLIERIKETEIVSK